MNVSMVDFETVLIPVDGSEGANRAAQFGARLATATQCTVTLMFVMPAQSSMLMNMSKLSDDEIQHIEHSAARAAMDKARQVMGDIGTQAEEVVTMGDPAEEIIHYVHQHPDTLVVMGRRGLSRMQSLLVGSVSEKVVRHAGSAVTLVQ